MSVDPDDKSLMLRFQEEGDLRAFETLFARNKDALLRFVMRLSGSEAVAEDLSQQAWLRVVELAETGGFNAASGATFQTFLLTMARNRYVDEYVRKHESVRTESLTDHDVESLGETAETEELIELLDREHTRSRVHSALLELSFEQREVLALWVQGFDMGEIARITRAPWHTVVSRKKYALRKLAALLKGAEQEVPP
jgi:RNA polymerase sigma-70 factor (ECF subfamily)